LGLVDQALASEAMLQGYWNAALEAEHTLLKVHIGRHLTPQDHGGVL
jgi:hypothetical protein